MLPTFLIIGAMKGGTDSLYQYLRSHPQVFMSHTKELDFFVEKLNWSKGLAWYESQFDDANGALAIGEASTSYAKYPFHQGVPERIAETLPNARLIYLVRHPIQRIRSHYMHRVLVDIERDPIELALVRNPIYLDASRYAMQIERYLPAFSPDRLLVIVSEDLRDHRLETMRRVFGFIGVNEAWSGPVLEKEFHRTAEKRTLRPFFRRLQRIPGYRALAGLVPEGMREHTAAFRTRGIDPLHVEIPAEIERLLERELSDDVRNLRKYVGARVERWGID